MRKEELPNINYVNTDYGTVTYNGCIGAEGPVGCPGTQIGPINNNSKIRNISIRQLSYGYMVNIGCQDFAIETADKLIEYLTKYINKPDETEKDWYNGNLLKTKNETN